MKSVVFAIRGLRITCHGRSPVRRRMARVLLEQLGFPDVPQSSTTHQPAPLKLRAPMFMLPLS